MSMKRLGGRTSCTRVSLSPSKIPYGGFSPVRLQGRLIRQRLPVTRWVCIAYPVCLRPSCIQLQTVIPARCRETSARFYTAIRAALPLYPRGPRSGPGCSVPVHQHLSTPSAPLAGTSRLHRCATYTQCLRCAGKPTRAAPRSTCPPRRPTSGSELLLRVPSRHAVLYDPEELIGCIRPVPSPTTWPYARLT
jgi:hypothetical protein